MKIKICKRCNKKRKIRSRGLCASCYNTILKKGEKNKYRKLSYRTSKCKRCGKKRKIISKRLHLCKSCYITESKKQKRTKTGSLVVLYSFDIDKEKSDEYIEQMEEKILEDVINNPRKWLDKVK